MRNGLQQNTSLRQELKVNPRLYQAMDLLYMPLLDLQQHLKQELLTNPFLELVEPEDDEGETPDPDEDTEAQDLAEAESVTEAQTEPEKTGDDDVDWEAVLLDGFETGGMREESDDREWYEPVTVDTRDLSDHLKEQIGLIDLTPRQAFLADEFIGNINDDGYLAISLEDIRNSVNEVLTQEMADRDDDIVVDPYTEAEVEAMLVIIQELDPPGVGARNLRECLRRCFAWWKKPSTNSLRIVGTNSPSVSASAHSWCRARPMKSSSLITSRGFAIPPRAITTSFPISSSSV